MADQAPQVPEDLFREVKYYAVGDIDPQVPRRPRRRVSGPPRSRRGRAFGRRKSGPHRPVPAGLAARRLDRLAPRRPGAGAPGEGGDLGASAGPRRGSGASAGPWGVPRPERRVEHVGGSAPEFLLLRVPRVLARPSADCRAVLRLALPGVRSRGRKLPTPTPTPTPRRLWKRTSPPSQAGSGPAPVCAAGPLWCLGSRARGLLAGPGWQPPSCHLCAPEKRSVHQRIRIPGFPNWVLGELYSKCRKDPLSTIHTHPLKLSSVGSCERLLRLFLSFFSGIHLFKCQSHSAVGTSLS